jgi:hypothetical protein
LNSDSKFGFEGKEFKHPFGYQDWNWLRKRIMHVMQPRKFLGEYIILTNFRNSKFRVVQAATMAQSTTIVNTGEVATLVGATTRL